MLSRQTTPQVRELDSTNGYISFILNSPGNCDDLLCQLIGFVQRKNKHHIFMTERNSATWSKVPTEVKLLPSHRLGDRGAMSLDDYISKR